MGCANAKSVPVVLDDSTDGAAAGGPQDTASVNPLAAAEGTNSAVSSTASSSATVAPAPETPAITPLTASDGTKEETDADFLARKEAEAKAEFAAAVEEWRRDKAAGRGEARIVEAGGAFATKNTDTADTREAEEATDEAKDEAKDEDTDDDEDDLGLGLAAWIPKAIKKHGLPAEPWENA